jgi:ParB family chromosome partitioning protein
LTATLNLDALDALESLDALGKAGAPLALGIELVHEDPGQPRKSFDPVKLAELTESIRASGVKSPVSVRPHPDRAGHYILNFGARRYRASIAAGRTTIPAFVDEAHTDFEQVVENLQRDDLSPMEMALFIQAKVREGVKKGEIARRLGISSAAVSKYLVLVEGPEEIEALYSSGTCMSPETLYEVSGLIGKWPNETRTWLAQNEEVTRSSVEAMKRRLSDKAHAGQNGERGGGDTKAVEAPSPPGNSRPASPSSPSEPAEDADTPKPRFWRPVLFVSVEGRHAVAMLDERPQSDRALVVRFEDTQEQSEVSVDAIRIERVAEDQR